MTMTKADVWPAVKLAVPGSFYCLEQLTGSNNPEPGRTAGQLGAVGC